MSPLDTMPPAPPHENTRPAYPTLGTALRFWLKLGFISFGGPAGQIVIMHEELVVQRRWISERRFLHALNFCMLLPGPEAQQLATYLGWLLHRTPGGIAAGALFVLPGLLVLMLLSWLYVSFGQLPIIAGIFFGIKPAVTALVLQATLRIGSRALKNVWLWVIAASAFLAIFALQLPFPAIIAAAALTGYLGGRFAPQVFDARSAHGGHSAANTPALIDDDTPAPAHARFAWRGLLRTLGIGIVLGSLPLALLTLSLGWAHPLTQMAWFFSKAALLGFGGAYALLPYFHQGAVMHYGWLSAPQMMDGLALGETTPGPLIMIVVFIAFVGGVQNEAVLALCHGNTLLAGSVAALLVTWASFLPSFIFILAGGPFIESTHGALHFTAPLTAITAAVVGVIFNLALFFAWHVFWPQGLAAGVLNVDVASVLIALAAAFALLRLKIGVMPVIAASAACGLVWQMLLH